MNIKMSDGGTWSTAARKAHELSKCNRDVTLYVRYNNWLHTWFILDWEPEYLDARWNYLDGYSNHLNGERV